MSSIPEIRSFKTTVTDVTSLGPRMKRITITSEDLQRMATDDAGHTLDLRIKVIIPAAGHPLPDISALMADADGRWYQRWLAIDEKSRGHMRTYTVRELRRERGELDLDFVIHPPQGHEPPGPASHWAEQAQPGDSLVILGPNRDSGNCRGIEFQPGTAQRLLLIGDETAVPAIAAILESLDSQITGDVLLEMPNREDFLELETPPGVQLTWLARDGAAYGEKLLAATRKIYPESTTPEEVSSSTQQTGTTVELEEVDIDQQRLWEVPPETTHWTKDQSYVWIAGESGAVKELRRYLVRDVGMDRKQIAFMGYWRQGKAEM